jgi:hypothetical protein
MKLRRLARKEGNEFSHKTYKTGKNKGWVGKPRQLAVFPVATRLGATAQHKKGLVSFEGFVEK